MLNCRPAELRGGSTAPGPLAAAAEATARQLLDAAAEACLQGQGARARDAARAAQALARERGLRPHLLGEACAHAAVAANLLLDPLSAYAFALEAEALLAGGPPDLRALALHAGAVACAEAGDPVRALEHLQDALLAARAAENARAAARVLQTRGMLLAGLDRHEPAVSCLVEAAALFASSPAGRPQDARVACIELAQACLGRARKLAQAGAPARALAWRRRAAAALPPLPASDPAEVPAPGTPAALEKWVMLQAELGDLAQARRALPGLRRLRSPGERGLTWQALAAYHHGAGRLDRGLRRQALAVAGLDRAGWEPALLQAKDRLAALQAARGWHTQALATLRSTQAGRVRLQARQARLRSRLGDIEREMDQRRCDLSETVPHLQRLAVVGRLMADIYHALDTPITQMQETLTRCTATAQADLPGAALRQVIEQVDAATRLARQLKMFSYRAAPQGMVVNLHESLREAWNGVALWRRGSPRELQVTGDLGTQVQVDAQRLAVLLRILLIEADRDMPAAALSARIVRGMPCSTVELGCRPAAGPPAAESGSAASAAGSSTSVGFMLCQEIVQEISGHLVRTTTAQCQVGFVLQLPGV